MPMPGEPTGVLSGDTTADAERAQIRAWRAMTSVQRAQVIGGACRAARTLALAGLRRQYPDLPEPALVERLARLTLGESLARRVYPNLFQAGTRSGE